MEKELSHSASGLPDADLTLEKTRPFVNIFGRETTLFPVRTKKQGANLITPRYEQEFVYFLIDARYSAAT